MKIKIFGIIIGTLGLTTTLWADMMDTGPGGSDGGNSSNNCCTAINSDFKTKTSDSDDSELKTKLKELIKTLPDEIKLSTKPIILIDQNNDIRIIISRAKLYADPAEEEQNPPLEKEQDQSQK